MTREEIKMALEVGKIIEEGGERRIVTQWNGKGFARDVDAGTVGNWHKVFIDECCNPCYIAEHTHNRQRLFGPCCVKA